MPEQAQIDEKTQEEAQKIIEETKGTTYTTDRNVAAKLLEKLGGKAPPTPTNTSS